MATPTANMTEVFKNLYTDNYQHLYQQQESHLSRFVDIGPVKGERYSLETIGKESLVKRKAKYRDITGVESTFERRWNSTDSYNKYQFIDSAEDVIKATIDPQSDIMLAYNSAEKRLLDQIVLNSACANVIGGKDADGTISYDTNNTIAAASTGFTESKLLALNEKCIQNEIPSDQAVIVVIGPRQLTQLMGIDHLVNKDFNDFAPLPGLKKSPGVVGTFMNFVFVCMNGLTVSSGTRSCVAFVNKSIHVGVPKPRRLRLEPASWKEDDVTLIGIEAHYGAFRKREEAVFKLNCVEA